MDFIDCGPIIVRRPLPRTDRHILAGTVKDDGTPVSRRLALFLVSLLGHCFSFFLSHMLSLTCIPLAI